MGGRTARKERRKMSILEELPGSKRSRSAQALDKNCEGESAHLFQKMFQLLKIKDRMVVEGLWFGE